MSSQSLVPSTLSLFTADGIRGSQGVKQGRNYGDVALFQPYTTSYFFLVTSSATRTLTV